MNGPLVLKLGGELLESSESRTRLSAMVAALAGTRPVVVVHGGGRAIDAALDRVGIAPRKIDGLRITDAPTLDVVVSVLGGQSNTELVAALVAQGVQAVGLTGVDAAIGRARLSSAHRSANGAVVDLGLVGDPVDADASLIELLIAHGYVPVVASLGLEVAGARVLNVNADVMACRLAAALSNSDLVIAGATAGVFDGNGQTLPLLDVDAVESLIASGTATAGMIAKLSACREALLEGVASVRIVDGRAFAATNGPDAAPGTTLVLSRQMAEKS